MFAICCTKRIQHRQRKHYCHPDRTINEVYEATCRKTRQLQQAGYKVIEKWECAFNKDKKTDLQLQEFLKTFQLVEPLNPRDSFFGGRTNAVCLYAEAKESEAIHYVDINSLYPYVNKIKTYPVGHPDILLLIMRRETTENTLVETNRVLFTWCTPDLRKAAELGYEIVKIYEVWNFPEDQRREGLFADYVKKWLKNKTEATGWPKNCVTDELKDAYITDYYAREGVQLEPNKIGKNFGRKQVAKLMLNSFGGKFGEKPNKTQTFTVTRPGQMYRIIEESGNNIHDIRICTENIVEVDVRKVVEEVILSSKTNIFIASITTTCARLELYEYLESLKDQVLYFDTDSIIYQGRKGSPTVETGRFLS